MENENWDNTSLSQRVAFICKKYFGDSVTRMSDEIGIPRTTIRSIIEDEKRSPRVDVLQKIVANTPIKINPTWLISGEGEMVRDSSMLKIHNPPYPEAVHEMVKVPLYDVKASANLSMTMDQEKENVIGYISIPNMPSVDGAVAVVGDSMYPIIKSGDIVVFKWIHSPEYITFGEMYLISYMWDDDKHVAVKYVKRSKLPEHITLVSYNSNYDPIDIPVQNIQSIALVKVSIRYNTII